jgi:hypothetical protein
MQRAALALAAVALVATAVATPGPFVAFGAAIGAIGLGVVGYTRRDALGVHRLMNAAAIALGAVGLVLGALRIVLALAAIGHLERML